MNLIRLKIALVLGAGLFFASCSKEKIELPQSNDPVFMIDGVFGSENFSLVAGDDGAYMYTTTDEINGVNFFKGALTDGSMSIEMGIFDGQLDNPMHDASMAIVNPSVVPQFASINSQPLVELSKDMFSNSSTAILSVVWYANNDSIGTDYAEIYEPGLYEICAAVTFSDSSTATLCNEMIVGYQRAANCTIEYSVNQENQLTAYIINAGGAVSVSNVDWYYNGSLVSNMGSIQGLQLTNAGVIEAVIHFNGGATRTKRIYVNPGNVFKSVDDFTMFEEQQSNSIEQDFNLKLEIIQDGVEYSSYLADNTGSSISILGFEYYGKNSNDNDVYKITATINAKVRAMGVMKQVPVLFTTTFGVEIP